MGGHFGRNRNDLFYSAQLPPGDGSYLSPLQCGLSTLINYDPYREYRYTHTIGLTTPSIDNYYGTRRQQVVSKSYGGRYAQGLNQAPGMAPWNYGNYYLGNTTMQMLPLAMNQFQQLSPPISSMAAAATPLPVAFNPLVQGMYPMASMNPVSWMAPSSFMSALMSGPMPYRPPVYEFPSNVNMVMAVPYGTPNPLLSSPGYGGGGGQSWNNCGWSGAPSVPSSTPIVSYYPQQINMGLTPRSLPLGTNVPSGLSYAHQPNIMTMHNQPKSKIPKIKLRSHHKYRVRDSQAFAAPNLVKPMLVTGNNSSKITGDAGWNSASHYFHSVGRLFGSCYGKQGSNSLSRPPPHSPAIPQNLHGTLIEDSGWLAESAAYGNSKEILYPMYVNSYDRLTLQTDTSKMLGHSASASHPIQIQSIHSESSVAEADCDICQKKLMKGRLRDYFGMSMLKSRKSHRIARNIDHVESK